MPQQNAPENRSVNKVLQWRPSRTILSWCLAFKSSFSHLWLPYVQVTSRDKITWQGSRIVTPMMTAIDDTHVPSVFHKTFSMIYKCWTRFWLVWLCHPFQVLCICVDTKSATSFLTIHQSCWWCRCPAMCMMTSLHGNNFSITDHYVRWIHPWLLNSPIRGQ